MARTHSRRDFLKSGSGALIAGAVLPGGALAAPPPPPPPGYRAVVFVNLDGGNDSFNTVVPMGSGYAAYAAARGAQLAIPQGQLLPLPWGVGLHPNLGGLASRAGRLAIVANCGPLVVPTTKQQYLSNAVPLPPQLFSHSDQSRLWQSPAANSPSNALGWGTLMAASVALQNDTPALSAVSMVGQTRMVDGGYAMSPNGPVTVYGAWGGAGARRRATLNALVDLPSANPMVGAVAARMRQSLDLADQVGQVFPGSPNFPFPSTSIGGQLRGIARMIACRQQLGMQRQVFFARQGGYDTHEDATRARHGTLMLQLDQALSAFDDALTTMNVDVAVCVYSEFGRALRSNGHGSDHGWAGHQLVFGPPVIGGIYGTMPTPTVDGINDVGSGRMIPTTSHEQLGATLAMWLGAPTTIFPNLGHFATSNLGCL